jgi:hypothetical protein
MPIGIVVGIIFEKGQHSFIQLIKKWYNGTTSLPWNKYKVEMFLAFFICIIFHILFESSLLLMMKRSKTQKHFAYLKVHNFPRKH